MKITRKKFIKSSLLTALGLGIVPRSLGVDDKQDISKRMLGRTGIQVTTLGIGASRTQEPAILKAAMKEGVNFLDTGRAYANGQNEVMIGKTLKGRRDRFVIQSKMKVDLEDGISPAEIREQMEASLKESLKALQTDYIDVMLLHGARDIAMLQNGAIRQVFTEMRAQGKIRACGFSSHSNHVNLLKQANDDQFFDVVMVPFNPFGGFKHSRSGWSTSWDQQALIREMKRAQENGIGVVAMKTCSGGRYSYGKNDEPSFGGAVKWVRSNEFVATTAVAMASFSEVAEHTGMA